MLPKSKNMWDMLDSSVALLKYINANAKIGIINWRIFVTIKIYWLVIKSRLQSFNHAALKCQRFDKIDANNGGPRYPRVYYSWF